MDTRTPFDPSLARWHPKAKEDYAAALRQLTRRIELQRRNIAEHVPPAHQAKARRKLDKRERELREELKQRYGHPPATVSPSDAGDPRPTSEPVDQISMF